jgi:serine/threonine protein kinase
LIEYTPGDSNMNVYMNSFHKSISFKTKLIIFTRFINGVNFLSHKQVVHMDLKPGNVLVGGGLRVKIIDFGSAYHPWLSKQSRYLF